MFALTLALCALIFLAGFTRAAIDELRAEYAAGLEIELRLERQAERYRSVWFAYRHVYEMRREAYREYRSKLWQPDPEEGLDV